MKRTNRNEVEKLMIKFLRDKMDKMPFSETKTQKAKAIALEVRRLEALLYPQLIHS